MTLSKRDARRWWRLLDKTPKLARALRKVKGLGWYVWADGAFETPQKGTGSNFYAEAVWLPACAASVLAAVARVAGGEGQCWLLRRTDGMWEGSAGYHDHAARTTLAAVLAVAEEVCK